MDYEKTAIEKEKKIVDLVKQNNYEIDFKLLNKINHSGDMIYTYWHMIRLIICKNNIVYCKLRTEKDIYIAKFKDAESIHISLNRKYRIKSDYNFDYNEENIVIAGHAFIVTYNNYEISGEDEIAIIDKDSKKLLIIIDQKGVSINSDIFKFLDKSIYKHYKDNSQWLKNDDKPLPQVLVPIITKYQVLLSLSS